MVKNIRMDVKKKLDKLRDKVFFMHPEEMLIVIKSSYPLMKELANLIIEFGERFGKKQKRKGSIRF